MSRLLIYLAMIGLTVLNTDILFSQNRRIALSDEDVLIERAKNGYELYVRQKGDIDRIHIFVKTGDNTSSELFQENGSVLEAQKIVKHRVLDKAFYTFIPVKTFVDSGLQRKEFFISGNVELIIKTYSTDDYKKDNTIIKNIKPIKNNTPVISIEGIEDSLEYLALYLSYSGGDNGDYAFYFREGRESTEYNLLPTIWGIDDKDAVATVLRDSYIEGIGKQLLVKVYFKKTREERYIGFNVFNKTGQTKTAQIEYVIGNYTPPVIERKTISKEVKNENINIVEKRKIELPREENKTEEKIYLEDDNKNQLLLRPSEIKEISTNNTITPDRNILNTDFEKTAKELSKNMDLPDEIKKSVFDNDKTSLDLIIVLDTTMSMDEVMSILKSSIQELSKKVFNDYEYARIGFVLFKDIGSDYVTKIIPYMRDYRDIVNQVKYFSAYGGGDLEEPIYEAIDTALSKFDFKSKNRLVLVITDTTSKVINNATLSSTTNKANKLGVKVKMIKTKPANRSIADIEREILGF